MLSRTFFLLLLLLFSLHTSRPNEENWWMCLSWIEQRFFFFHWKLSKIKINDKQNKSFMSSRLTTISTNQFENERKNIFIFILSRSIEWKSFLKYLFFRHHFLFSSLSEFFFLQRKRATSIDFPFPSISRLDSTNQLNWTDSPQSTSTSIFDLTNSRRSRSRKRKMWRKCHRNHRSCWDHSLLINRQRSLEMIVRIMVDSIQLVLV